ncbi:MULTISPECIES: class I SAM-dependent methyltransferase [Salinibaculum]|uniref:class I SAM-dependent methyltransferase n=1 Tax=Salinibaculum TaxID=2732368 RepID=UPI0030CC270D
MSDVPETVATALADVPVAGRPCLEAGAGAGNATAALLARDAGRVYAVTHDADHAATVRDRFRADPAAATLRGDLRSVPLPDDGVDVVTAHALFNVVAPADVTPILSELTRVTAPGGWLVVDDYDPIEGPVRDLFGLANATAELTDARPAYTFYPREHLRSLVTAAGWDHQWTRTLLDPVPWTPDLLDAHADLIADRTAELPADLRDALRARLQQVRERTGDGVDVGTMYSLVFRLPE